jgi:RNA polymerase sigma-B factor
VPLTTVGPDAGSDPSGPGQGPVGPADQRSQRSRELLEALAVATDPTERQQLRRELVELHLPLAEYLARRFAGRGEPVEDLVQVGTIGLLKSVDGFDVGRGCEFARYAVPTILGELRRHFRDRGWTIRPPRQLQELRRELMDAGERLTQRLGRTPTTHDLAVELGLSDRQVLDGLVSSHAYSALSLEATEPSSEAPMVADPTGAVDEGFELVETRDWLRQLVDTLPEREQRVVWLRFYGDRTQAEIAAELGISQVHVSRLLSRSLGSMRERLQLAG